MLAGILPACATAAPECLHSHPRRRRAGWSRTAEQQAAAPALAWACRATAVRMRWPPAFDALLSANT